MSEGRRERMGKEREEGKERRKDRRELSFNI